MNQKILDAHFETSISPWPGTPCIALYQIKWWLTFHNRKTSETWDRHSTDTGSHRPLASPDFLTSYLHHCIAWSPGPGRGQFTSCSSFRRMNAVSSTAQCARLGWTLAWPAQSRAGEGGRRRGESMTKKQNKNSSNIEYTWKGYFCIKLKLNETRSQSFTWIYQQLYII